ncbi:STAS domain-containing protein [Streptomyces sp. NPDC006645]|uniref:STAS domain-containing protein n=1 Tax=unclassified Streptomyces TaxID=2593676 RepID=UPI0033B64D2D
MITALTLTTRETPAGPVIRVRGDLDNESAAQFHTAVDAAPVRPGHVLTIDLADLTFCDSSGITALIAARNRAHALGADITLTAVPAPTARTMRVLGLDQIFPLHPAPDPADPRPPA